MGKSSQHNLWNNLYRHHDTNSYHLNRRMVDSLFILCHRGKPYNYYDCLAGLDVAPGKRIIFKMESKNKIARTAGLLYLIVVLTGIFSLMYVPSRLIVWTDAAKSFSNILESETLFRLGIIASIICYVAFLLLPLVLYQLLNEVHKKMAAMMVALAVVSVPFSLFNLMFKMNALTLITDSSYLQIDLAGRQAEVLLLLDYYNNGIQIVSVFWGLWLFPFGYLVFRSGFLPKFLGLMLMLGCFGYLINFTGSFLFSDYVSLGIRTYVSLPASIGEIGICLWLLVFGVRKNLLSGHAISSTKI